ncbi:glycosyltransferase family 2 protein [Alteromonas flava]|uniref:glycosyltransferase family 2 protein n=1 Tax=Alteromonas flava TaxID=2048003 RepID=UPI001F0C7849|nr:glycosyltransferase [Alteromonas flava]
MKGLSLRAVLRFFLLSARSVLHRLPDSWRKRLREQHRLLELYSRVLHLSHLFYGTLSPKKQQARYNRLLQQQEQKLALLAADLDEALQMNALLVNTLGSDPSEAIQALVLNARIATVFVIDANYEANLAIYSSFEKVCVLRGQNDFTGDIPLVVLRNGEFIHELAIAAFASELLVSPNILTCDHDIVQRNGTRGDAKCFPSWDPDLQLASGYIDSGFCVREPSLQAELVSFVMPDPHPMRLALWLADLNFKTPALKVSHVAFSLLHRKVVFEESWGKYVSTFYTDMHWPVTFMENSTDGHAIVKWPMDESPLVSIIIPTRNGRELVETCIQSILSKTSYSNYEILLIDNQSDDIESIEYFNQLAAQEAKVRLIQYPFVFNYSAINNFAVKQAHGSVLAFVNNDIEVISPDWLSNMVMHALRDDIGCVGAKLYYPNRRIQHAGVVLGYGGGAGHAHKYFPDYHAGYLNRIACTHSFSAVTAACLLIQKTLFNQVNGFNEEKLAVAFNDVDLCLKVASLGHRNLYCAQAELFHYESVSRGSENTPEKRARFELELNYLKEQWAEFIAADPAYSPNLTLRQENFAIKE